MDETLCPWCGTDMNYTGKPMTPAAFDTELEGHVMECEPAMGELGMES